MCQDQLTASNREGGYHFSVWAS